MKKVRLTESDLARIVKHIINEQPTSEGIKNYKELSSCLVKNGFKIVNTYGKYELYARKQASNSVIHVSSEDNKDVVNVVKEFANEKKYQAEITYVGKSCESILTEINNVELSDLLRQKKKLEDKLKEIEAQLKNR